MACCPFHHDTNPSFNINLNSGLFKCHSCGMSGNLTQFVAEMEGISRKEAFARLNDENCLQVYADKKNLNRNVLSTVYGITSGKGHIKIPYYDEEHNKVALRFRNMNKSNKKSKFSWEKGSKITLYGLWTINEMQEDYVVLVERRK